MCTGAPKMVCYLMKTFNLCTENTNGILKKKLLMLLRYILGFIKIITYQWCRDMHIINPIFSLLEKMKQQRTEILLSNMDMLKQLETIHKDCCLNLIIKSCLNTLKIIVHFQWKNEVPGSYPLQTIWKWTKKYITVSLTLIWWIKEKCINNTRENFSLRSVFDWGRDVLIEVGTIFDNTYGCAKQYRYKTALYFISVFCANKDVCIE